MKTYQDLEKLGGNEAERMQFIESAIREYSSSEAYKTAERAEQYYRHLNPTIMAAQKIVYDMLGQAKVDQYSPNNKIPSAYYGNFVSHEVQFLLGNGVSFSEKATRTRLGKGFDAAVQKLTTYAINAGVAFGFWNFDHLEVFPVCGGTDDASFVPLWDEETGGLRAGIRYWQIDPTKPLRCTLYELDGLTEYIKRGDGNMEQMDGKRPYVQTVGKSEIGGTEILSGSNYPGFPIIPLYNINRQSELIGNQETIDAYDLMASALVNNVDDGNLIYWVLKNCGGMSQEDDAKFLENLRMLKVAHADGDDGAQVEAHSVEAPFQANEAALERLRTQLYDDFCALDTRGIANGAATATQILAAYEPLNGKADRLETQVTSFINALLALIGVEDEPTYTRSYLINRSEEIQSLLLAAQYLPRSYVTQKLLELMGDMDRVDEIEKQMVQQEAAIVEPTEDGEV